MKSARKLNRRSFLARVAGGAVVAGGALGLTGGGARAGQVTDRDPSDPVGRGRGGGTGLTDADSGPGADPAGRGRGASGPPRGVGEYTGVTDADTGANADPPQRGRGRQFGADVNDARRRQLAECQAARGQLNQLDFEINRRDERLRGMQTTYNFIAGGIRELRGSYGDQANRSVEMMGYQRRAAQYGVDTPYGTQPEALLSVLGDRIQQETREIEPYRQQRAQLANAMAQYNCQ